ncbi:serine threonine-protein kinase haspin-like protein [Lasius niger]|uniref:Serine threonine-protein kinase haspin-like protein n=1 Tax=Lasius niger TaxID=67767 RepID=A0A0J7KPQ6_LASNI|nr:serine threonine-protein kinase haspin-like protein [Lasius niger]
MGDLQMPYLRAIQKIPGDTASEKLRWIGKFSYPASGDLDQLPQELVPLLRVEAAVKMQNPENITFALSSENMMIVNRAFKAFWYFDGSFKSIVNADYFCEHVFPLVSMNTRVRILSTLANRLIDPAFAKELFDKVATNFGVYNACPLIAACDEDFAYEMIDYWKLALPIKTVKQIFRKNPNLFVRYLKLLKPPANTIERGSFPVDINRYAFLLPKLVKHRLEAFAELLEMHEARPLKITLSNTCAEIFLKKGQQYLNKKPRLYIDILPLKKISIELMESIFLGLLPVKISSFDTNSLLNYLQHYPQNKRYELLRQSYMKKYGTELLDTDKNVTPALLRVLPAKERIEQAKIKLEKEKLGEIESSDLMYYEKAWICYLPIDKAIPEIKEKISKKAAADERLYLICQMIYACKVNEDDDALIDTLQYFKNRHKNEDFWIFERTMDQLLLWYDVPHLSEKHHSLLFDIIKLFYVKHGYMPEKIVETVIHFRLIHDMPIDELILILIDTLENRWLINFNLLQEYPQYERKCLVTFAKMIQEKYSAVWPKQEEESTESKKRILCRLVVAMYDFNKRCKKSCTKIERITIKDYPWILDTIRAIIRSNRLSWDMKDVLKIKEPEFNVEPQGLDSSKKKIADVTTGAALALLKRNPQDILDNWEEYLTSCKKEHFNKTVQRFVRATRWYKDIPIKFVERCMDYLEERRKDKTGMFSTLTMLALLLHGHTLTKLLEPLVPKEMTIDASDPEASENYKLLRHLPLCMRLSSPPVPLQLVGKLCEGDYLSIALMTLSNLSRRSVLPKVLSFANKLSGMRVGVRKHAIRLMYEIAPVEKLLLFLKKMWDDETNHSIRQVIFDVIQKLVSTEPTGDNWYLLYSVVQTIRLKDEMLLMKLKLPLRMPNKYVSHFFEMWLEAIDDLELSRLDISKMNQLVISFLKEITAPSACNLICEDFTQHVIQRYLFDVNADVSEAARGFAMSYLFPEDKNKLTGRSKIFIDTLKSVMKAHWNETHPKKSRFFPYNNAVHLFVEDFVVRYVNKFYLDNKSTDMQLIDNMLTLFSYVLAPTQAPRAYLLLTYAKKLQECTLTNQCFGLQLGQYMPELVKIFTSSMVQFMAKILEHFLDRVFKDHIDLGEFKLTVIEGLIKADNTNSCFMAVSMLSPVTLKNLATRYDQLIVKFQETKNPAITSILHDYLNVLDFQSIMFD